MRTLGRRRHAIRRQGERAAYLPRNKWGTPRGLPARLVSDGTGLEALTQSVATAVMNCCVFYGALKLNASAK